MYPQYGSYPDLEDGEQQVLQLSGVRTSSVNISVLSLHVPFNNRGDQKRGVDTITFIGHRSERDWALERACVSPVNWISLHRDTDREGCRKLCGADSGCAAFKHSNAGSDQDCQLAGLWSSEPEGCNQGELHEVYVKPDATRVALEAVYKATGGADWTNLEIR